VFAPQTMIATVSTAACGCCAATPPGGSSRSASLRKHPLEGAADCCHEPASGRLEQAAVVVFVVREEALVAVRLRQLVLVAQSDLSDDADEQLVDSVIEQRRNFDELALASRRQPGAICKSGKFHRNLVWFTAVEELPSNGARKHIA
jgi:hypothetical protein